MTSISHISIKSGACHLIDDKLFLAGRTRGTAPPRFLRRRFRFTKKKRPKQYPEMEIFQAIAPASLVSPINRTTFFFLAMFSPRIRLRLLTFAFGCFVTALPALAETTLSNVYARPCLNLNGKWNHIV